MGGLEAVPSARTRAWPLRFESYGGGGDLTQSNASFAESIAANYNALEQALAQAQGALRR